MRQAPTRRELLGSGLACLRRARTSQCGHGHQGSYTLVRTQSRPENLAEACIGRISIHDAAQNASVVLRVP